MKRVICIKELDKYFCKEITMDKIYIVLDESEDQYTIKNDNGHICDYYKFRFKIIDNI